MSALETSVHATTAGVFVPDTGAAAARLDELGLVSDEAGMLTRLYLSPAHRKAIDLVDGWMREAGMNTRLDSVATLIGRYEGTRIDAPALLIGSHIDTVRNAGRFDGNLGVVSGIEVVRAFHAAGKRFPFAIEVVAFGDEEGVRFDSTLGGSRALAGTFDMKALDERDSSGVSRRDALRAFGCDVSLIDRSERTRRDTIGYVEVHIEQGPVLEVNNIPVGVVTAINGASRGKFVLTGKASHAGTTPMDLRKDALAAAAEIIVMVERSAHAEADLVATVGQIDTPGGTINTVPGLVRMTFDVRCPSDELRHKSVADILANARAIAASRKVAIDIDISHDAPASPSDERLSRALAQAVERCELPLLTLSSGAGHDAMAFRGILPFAMLFVRCRDGLSHHPDEYATPQDINIGVRVLAEFIQTLHNQQVDK